MTNTNCLEGIKCPGCGNADRFFITATIRADVTDGGADIADGSDFHWNELSLTICPECDKDGPLFEFQAATDSRKIITSFVYPPIPDRSHDWQATREGWEPGEPSGHGETEHQAVAELLLAEAEA